MGVVGELAVALGLQLDAAAWDKGSKTIQRLARSARRYIAGEAVRSVYHLVEASTESATHLVALSESMGMTVEQTQLWGYVAQQSGSSLKVLNEGLNMFVRNLENYVHGNGSKLVRSQFAALGIDAETAKKALAGPDGLNEVLLQVADRVKGMGRSGHVAALTRLFGRDAGRAILADFARGRKGIEELFQRRKGMGLISEEDAKRSRDLGNRMKDIKTSFTTLAEIIVARLAPGLIKMADAAVKWMSENKDIISGTLTAAFKGLAAAFSVIGDTISFIGYMVREALSGNAGAITIFALLGATILAHVIPAVIAMGDALLMSLDGAFAPLSAFILESLIPTLVSFATMVETTVIPAAEALITTIATSVASAAVALAPIIGIVLAIAAALAVLVYAGYELAKVIDENADKIKKTLGDAWDWVVEKGRAFGEWVENLPDVIWDAVKSAGRFIVDEFGKAFNWLMAEAAKVGNFLETVLGIKLAKRVYHYIAGDESTPTPTNPDSAENTYRRIRRDQALRHALPFANAGGGNVTVGETHVTINVKSVEEAKRAKEKFDTDRNNELRHAARGVGGQPK